MVVLIRDAIGELKYKNQDLDCYGDRLRFKL